MTSELAKGLKPILAAVSDVMKAFAHELVGLGPTLRDFAGKLGELAQTLAGQVADAMPAVIVGMRLFFEAVKMILPPLGELLVNLGPLLSLSVQSAAGGLVILGAAIVALTAPFVGLIELVNVLVRAIVEDDPRQSKVAQATLAKADIVALTIAALCELVWVLSQGYKISLPDISATLRRLTNSQNVVVNRPAVEAGLAQLEAGGDFADGVIDYEGSWLGAETFASFDKKAVKLMEARGVATRLLS
jgi:predicted nucleic-acid-binding protein